MKQHSPCANDLSTAVPRGTDTGGSAPCQPVPGPQDRSHGEPSPGLARVVEEVCQDLAPGAREATVAALLGYLRVLSRWSDRMNLVSREDRHAIVDKHLIPSLLLRPSLLGVRHDSVLDLGSGAGFPGIPLAVATGDARFTLVESRRRRASFLRAVIRELSLDNARVVNRRIQEWRPARPADVVLARSVAAPDRVAGLVEHVLAPDGFLLVTLPPSAGHAGGRRHTLWQPFSD